MQPIYHTDTINVVARVPGTYLRPGLYTATYAVGMHAARDSYVEVRGATGGRELIHRHQYAAGLADGKIVPQH